MLKETYANLSVPQKILLVEQIWDSIPQNYPVTLSKELKTEIDKRENEITSGDVKTKSWQQIKRGLKRRKK